MVPPNAHADAHSALAVGLRDLIILWERIMSNETNRNMLLETWEIECEAGPPKPCPFCGGKATLMSYGGTWNFVSCTADECMIKPFSWGDTKAITLARWNTRAPVGSDL